MLGARAARGCGIHVLDGSSVTSGMKFKRLGSRVWVTYPTRTRTSAEPAITQPAGRCGAVGQAGLRHTHVLGQVVRVELMGPQNVGALVDVFSHEDDVVLLVVLGVAGQWHEARIEEELDDVDRAPLAFPHELLLDLDENYLGATHT